MGGGQGAFTPGGAERDISKGEGEEVGEGEPEPVEEEAPPIPEKSE